MLSEINLSPIETSPSLVRIGEKGRKFEFIAAALLWMDVLLISRAEAKKEPAMIPFHGSGKTAFG